MEEFKKELIADIESTYSFSATILIGLIVAWGLYSDVTNVNFGTVKPELDAYMLLVYFSLSYFIFKLEGKKLGEKPLKWLKGLLTYFILFLTILLAFFASYDHKSIIIAFSALVSFPAIAIILFLIFTPYIYQLYLNRLNIDR